MRRGFFSEELMSLPVFPQQAITFLSSRREATADPLMEAAARSPSSICPAFPPDPNTGLSPGPNKIIPHARLQEGGAGQGGGRRSLLQEVFLNHRVFPIMSLQMLSSPANVPASSQMPGQTSDPPQPSPGTSRFPM